MGTTLAVRADGLYALNIDQVDTSSDLGTLASNGSAQLVNMNDMMIKVLQDLGYWSGTISLTAPPDQTEGDMWYDVGNHILKYWDGSTHQVITFAQLASILGWGATGGATAAADVTYAETGVTNGSGEGNVEDALAQLTMWVTEAPNAGSDPADQDAFTVPSQWHHNTLYFWNHGSGEYQPVGIPRYSSAGDIPATPGPYVYMDATGTPTLYVWTGAAYEEVGASDLPADAAGALINDGSGGLSYDDRLALPTDTPGALTNDGFGNLTWSVTGVATATESSTGVVELATTAEISAATAGALVVTAAELQIRLAALNIGSGLPADVAGALINDGSGTLSWDARLALPTNAAGALSNDGAGNLSWSETGVATATDSATGVVELATTAEISAGTSGALAVTAAEHKASLTALNLEGGLPADSQGHLYNNGSGTLSYSPPSWSTAARPGSPYVGQTGQNTTLNHVEVWDGTTWTLLAETIVPQSVTAAITAVAGDEVWVDSSGGAVTVTLPASPAVGDAVTVFRIGANDVAIAGNGNNVTGETTFVLDLDEIGVRCVFMQGQWQTIERVIG